FESDGHGRASNDLDDPGSRLGRGPCDLRPLIAAVAVDALNEREQAARAVVEQHGYPVAILNVASMHRHAHPSVSTRMWRLRPVIFLPASKPSASSEAPLLRALGALAFDDCCGGACLPSRLLAYRYIERVMDVLQRAIPAPEVEISPYRALRRQ